MLKTVVNRISVDYPFAYVKRTKKFLNHVFRENAETNYGKTSTVHKFVIVGYFYRK